MIKAEEAKKKIRLIEPGISADVESVLINVLDGKMLIKKDNAPKGIIAFIEKRLSQPHLAYIKQGQDDDVWDRVTTNALMELCEKYHIGISETDPVIGSTTLTAILDGSRQSKNAVREFKLGSPLAVRYYSQRDSQTEHAYRMCFSSSCAMLLNYLYPGILSGYNGDDQYLQKVLTFGDTTNSSAQIRALKNYGVTAEFRQNLTWADIDTQLKSGVPVPIGILHQGNLRTGGPEGFGHWIIVIGKTSDGLGYFVHDPYGELDLIAGQYINTNGNGLIYGCENLGKRWLDSSGHGWGIIAKRPVK